MSFVKIFISLVHINNVVFLREEKCLNEIGHEGGRLDGREVNWGLRPRILLFGMNDIFHHVVKESTSKFIDFPS